MFYKKATKFDKICQRSYVENVKSMVKILSILVAFYENMNFGRPVKIKPRKQVAKQQITCCISMLSASIKYQDFNTS